MFMYDYMLIRSARKTLAIEIKNGAVIVRAPDRMPKYQIEAFIAAKARWIDANLEKSRRIAAAEPTDAEMEECIRRARTELPLRVKRFGQQMGLTPNRVTITGARTRFGSCSSKGNICFSWRLMLYPDAAIDYVVVHELAHLRHMNHSRDFYVEIARILPDYKEREAMLRHPPHAK